MNLRPLFSAKDLMQVFQISERTARHRMAAVIDQRQKRYHGAATYKNPGGSKPYLVYADDVAFQFGVTRAAVQNYIDRQLTTSLYSLIDEQDLKRMLEGSLIKRNIWFVDNNYEQICIQRICFFPIEDGYSDINPQMNRIATTIFPVGLLSNITNADFKELFAHSELAAQFSKVFWDQDLNRELTGYLSKMTGRNYPVDEIVLIDELECGQQDPKAELDQLLKVLAKKIDRKRSLVFLADSLLPNNPDQLLSQTGFQKLEGTHFYISGSIQKFKAVRFKIWFVREDKEVGLKSML